MAAWSFRLLAEGLVWVPSPAEARLVVTKEGIFSGVVLPREAHLALLFRGGGEDGAVQAGFECPLPSCPI